jgi:formyltetrahydrofolate hydrolase
VKKDEQSKRCKILLSEIFDKHKKLVTEMKASHKMKKDSLKLEKETLNAEIEQMITQHKVLREKVENDAWDYIERLKEKQSQELASEVDKGMKQKSELSLILTKFKNEKTAYKTAEMELDLMNKNLN